MNRLKFLFALWTAKCSGALIRRFAPGRGSSKPGELALAIDPQFIAHISGIDPHKVIFVTGTNGKSTTANLLNAMFVRAGKTVATNMEGANMLTGVAVTLANHATLSGRFKEDYLLLETDERFLPVITKQLKPAVLCVTNLQKDQVQRNGEPDVIFRKIASVITPQTTVVLNNEEPISKALAAKSDHVVTYSVADQAAKAPAPDALRVTSPCPVCGEPIVFDHYNIPNVGPFHCSNPDCGYASAEHADGTLEKTGAREVTFRTGGGDAKRYPIPYDTPYFLYCYSLALTAADRLGIGPDACREAMAHFENVGGRLESFRYKDKTVHYARMKQENPETMQSALDHIATDQTPKIFLCGLNPVADFAPFYTNTFYAFDCDFDALIASGVTHWICFSDPVAFDVANRLLYAGVPREQITVLPTNDATAVLSALDGFDTGNVYLITQLDYYEAMKKTAEAAS